MRKKIASAAFCFILLDSAMPAYGSDVIWTEMMRAARTAQTNQEWVKAKELLRSALREAETDKAESHEVQTLLWLGRLQLDIDEFADAETTLRKAEAKGSKVYDLDPKIRESIKTSLIEALNKQGKDIEAREMSITDAEKNWRKREIELRNNPFELGRLYFSWANYSKAEPLLERNFKSYVTIAELESQPARANMDMLYRIYRDSRRYEKAEKMLEGFLDTMKEQQESAYETSMSASLTFMYLAGLFALQGREVEAEAMANKAFNIINVSRFTRGHTVANSIIKTWKESGKEREAEFLTTCLNKRVPPQPPSGKTNADWED